MSSLYCLSMAACSILAMGISTTADLGSVNKVGDNTTVNAWVLYTTEQHGNKTGVENNSTIIETINDTMTTYFKELFQKVEQYFRYHNISIIFNVTNVTEIRNILVMYNKTKNVDGPKTLALLQAYGESYARSATNNTIFYLFTPHNITDYYDGIAYNYPNKSATTNLIEFSTKTKATYNTFCSMNVSAAVVTHDDLKLYSTAKATTFTFGSSFPPKTKDLPKLNETFHRCKGLGSEKSSKEAPSPNGC
uniref:28 kDa Metastriate family member n=1 Tax=Rhipicephalus appendiculatus TaxID=34631 RepID=A0A131YMH5_RHIAP